MDNFIFICSVTILYGTMTKLQYDITQITPERVSVEILFKVGELTESLGILYFEKAKRGYVRKPIGMNSWACVDASVEGLYTKDESITPTEIISEARNKIMEAGL